MNFYVAGFSLPHGRLDHKRADAQALHVVHVVEVVFQVELGEPERDEEGGVVGWAGWGVQEGDDEVRSVIESV